MSLSKSTNRSVLTTNVGRGAFYRTAFTLPCCVPRTDPASTMQEAQCGDGGVHARQIFERVYLREAQVAPASWLSSAVGNQQTDLLFFGVMYAAIKIVVQNNTSRESTLGLSASSPASFKATFPQARINERQDSSLFEEKCKQVEVCPAW